jgi:hypothetical protein
LRVLLDQCTKRIALQLEVVICYVRPRELGRAAQID